MTYSSLSPLSIYLTKKWGIKYLRKEKKNISTLYDESLGLLLNITINTFKLIIIFLTNET